MGGPRPGKVIAPPQNRDAGGVKQVEIDAGKLPSGAELQADGSILFKQTQDLFKQIHDHAGKVIGLMYKGPRMQAWSTLSESQVRARKNIYTKRSEGGEVSDAVARGLDVWEWALSLFSAEIPVQTDDMETIHMPEEVAGL